MSAWISARIYSKRNGWSTTAVRADEIIAVETARPDETVGGQAFVRLHLRNTHYIDFVAGTVSDWQARLEAANLGPAPP